MKRWVFGGKLALAAIAAAAVVPVIAQRGASPNHTVAGTDWPGHGGSSDETGFSTLTAIDRSNVSRLGLAWYLDLPDEQMLEAIPVAVDGVLYFTGSYAKVYAVDAATGKLMWSYDPEVWKHDPQKLRFNLPANRGVAVAEGRVFVGTLDGRLIALDAWNGKLLWSAATTTADSVQTITGAPRVFNGKVIIGQGGADFGARGYVTAYDQATGQQAWRFYVAPGSPEENRGDPEMERAAASWTGEFWKKGTGGGPWHAITFDRELNRIYIGTANAAPYDPEERSPGGGDNLYTAAIVAIDADTGRYVWHYQVNPRDSWDFDATQQITLTDLTIDGVRRKVLMQAPKNGFLYVIDRVSGKLISAGKIGKATWADRIDPATGRAVEAPNIRYQQGPVTIWPSTTGAHNWHAMAYSPQTGLLYIPYMQLGMTYAKRSGGDGMLGGLSMSIAVKDPEDGKGALVAYDPVRQQVRWKVQHNHFWNGGAMATAGGLVFQGDADGYLTAYDASNGRSLWRFNAGLGIIAAPVTYTVRGRQYVSVLTGYGASNMIGNVMNAGWKWNAQPRRLLTFALDARGTLPKGAPQDFGVNPVDDASIRIADADVAAGKALFNLSCAGCHGLNAASAGAPAPDLRESMIPLSREALWSVLHDGALLQRGMPRFEQLDATQVGQIQAFIRAQARQAMKSQSRAQDGAEAGDM